MNIKLFFDMSIKISSIKRYSQIHLSKEESVLEHTGFVVMLSHFIGSSIDNIDIGLLLTKAVVHDIDEIVTGDIPYTTKYANSRITEEIKKVESDNMIKISKDIYGNDSAYMNWLNAKDDTNEGKIVKLSDILAVLFKIYFEHSNYGNIIISEHSVSVKTRLLNMLNSNMFLFDKSGNIVEIIKQSIKMCDDIIGNKK